MDKLNFLQGAIARLLPHLTWRRHGVGMLQAYLHESRTGSEDRVHIWHPSCVRAGIFNHGDIHNHRFDFTSTVLLGEIRNQEITFTPALDGSFAVFDCVHARENIGARYRPTALAGASRAEGRVVQDRLYSEGQAYFFGCGRFHRSSATGLTVTYVRKYNQGNHRALIAALADAPAVHAMESEDTFDPAPIVDEARAKLLQAAGLR